MEHKINWDLRIWLVIVLYIALFSTGFYLELNKIVAYNTPTTTFKHEEKLDPIDWVLKRTQNAGMKNIDVIRLLDCESGLNPDASNINKDKSIDRGLWMINDKYQKKITSACAYDYKCSTEKAIELWNRNGKKFSPVWVCAKLKGIR